MRSLLVVKPSVYSDVSSSLKVCRSGIVDRPQNNIRVVLDQNRGRTELFCTSRDTYTIATTFKARSIASYIIMILLFSSANYGVVCGSIIELSLSIAYSIAMGALGQISCCIWPIAKELSSRLTWYSLASRLPSSLPSCSCGRSVDRQIRVLESLL